MYRSSFRCNDCNKFFSETQFYDEKHGLDNPPFERLAVCPICGSSNFAAIDFKIDKFEISEKILPAIALINSGINQIRDVFGQKSANSNLDGGIAMLNELMIDMFSFISGDIERKILSCTTEKDVERIFLYLKGDL